MTPNNQKPYLMKYRSALLISIGLFMASCTPKETNPLLSEWTSPFGVPPFDQVKEEHYMPAFKEAMKVHNQEIDAIVNNPEAPDFENTILALDNAGSLLSKVSAVFSSASGVRSNDRIMEISNELTPLRSAHSNEINMNDALFKRVKAVYDQRESLGLDPLQLKLVEETYKGFERSGADLPEDRKNELKKINSEISQLQNRFGQNLLKETAAYRLVIDNEDDLSGLSQAQKDLAAMTASKAGQDGKWMFGLDNPSVMPFLQFSDNRELREQIFNAYISRCNNDNTEDNKEVIRRLVDLRLQKARIMGYENYAQFVLVERMAKTPEAVYDLLDQLWKPALKAAEREAADMREIIAEEKSDVELEGYDWRYFFEKAKAKKYDLNENELKPYFRLENVRQGIFTLCNFLYGITFTQVTDVPLPHPEAVAFECKDADGTHLGLLFMDMFSRPGEKRGGAWCTSYRGQSYKDGKKVAPLVAIVANFVRPAKEGEPALLSPDEVETYFHEFGHALASLFKDVKYKGLGGMTRDFVELPSQIMEHWAFEPALLKEYAKHYETGEVIPQELVDKLVNSGKYGQGFATTEYLAASLLDMDYHVLKEIPDDFDVLAFESKVLGDRGLLPQIPPRYRSTYFNHTFGGGYTAGYYSYIWAEVLDSDAYQAFVETGDIFNREVARKFRKEILQRAGEDDAMTLYVNFRGSKPGIDALLENRGLK